MPLFEFQGVDPEGKPIRGTISASTVGAAAAELENRKLKIDQLGLAQTIGDPIPPGFGQPGAAREEAQAQRTRTAFEQHVVGPVLLKPSLTELLVFFRQLSTMLKAGVGMVQSLDTLSSQNRDPRLRVVIHEMSRAVQNGSPLSPSMQRYPEVFTPLMVALVRTGEEGGMLDECLNLVAEYVDREIRLRNLYRRLTFYPKMVVGASILIILAANMILASLNAPPGAPKLVSPLTDPGTWLCLGPTLAAAFIWFKVIVPSPAMRARWDMFVVSIPYIGRTSSQFALAKFGRALGALYKGGVPIHKAVQLAADACGNEYIRQQLLFAPKKLEEGFSLHQTFVESGVVSPIVLNMVQTGETTGNIDLMMDKVSQHFEDDSETRATSTAYVVGVVCLLAVGIYVGFVVVRFYTGYFGGIMSAGG